MQSQVDSIMDQNRGKNKKEAIERLDKRNRDHFRHKVHTKTWKKERKEQYSTFHT